MRKKIIAPSILSANFLKLGEDIEMINNSLAEWIHCDIMDGQFVPNISFGLPIVEAIRKHTNKTIDVHLMIENAENYIDRFIEAGADVVTVHYENNYHLHRLIDTIHKKNKLAGVAINPLTPVNVLEEALYYVDLVLIMSVNPGFGGQSFINSSFEKISKLAYIREKNNLNFLIQVDGGVNRENAKKLFSLGVDVLVAGNTIFNDRDPIKLIGEMLKNKKK